MNFPFLNDEVKNMPRLKNELLTYFLFFYVKDGDYYRVPEIVAYLNNCQDDYFLTDGEVRSYFEYYLCPRGPYTKTKRNNHVYYQYT